MDLETPVLIVGGGPIGQLTARSLSLQGVPSVLVERNGSTTKWPKMELVNARSMELFRRNRLDMADWLRAAGVPASYRFDVLFSSGFSEGGQLVGKWTLPSVAEYRAQIKQTNDGSMPREPWQRSTQSALEARLRELSLQDSNINSMWGVRFDSLVEREDGVTSTCTVLETGKQLAIRSRYVVGCDGASSKVRHSIGDEIRGGPLPFAFYLVHFRSSDLQALHKQGRFWHVMFLSGSAFIAQDEKDIWTIHVAVPADVDQSTLDPHATIANALGGKTGKPLAVKIDEILIHNLWQPSIYVADRFASTSSRIFLAGDSAHQLVPTGGYGFNTGVGDAVDISWKLAAVLKGHGGPALLRSYEVERRPVAERNNVQSGANMAVHSAIWDRVAQTGSTIVDAGPEGDALRNEVAVHYAKHTQENHSRGIELGYRYHGSEVVVADRSSDGEPPWSVEEYVPSTCPGARAPHVFLRNGVTSTYDLFGSMGEYTLVDFGAEAVYARRFEEEAAKVGLPLKVVRLPDEDHARAIWEREAVLVRPDDHVCWRSVPGVGVQDVDVGAVLRTVSGNRPPAGDGSLSANL